MSLPVLCGKYVGFSILSRRLLYAILASRRNGLLIKNPVNLISKKNPLNPHKYIATSKKHRLNNPVAAVHLAVEIESKRPRKQRPPPNPASVEESAGIGGKFFFLFCRYLCYLNKTRPGKTVARRRRPKANSSRFTAAS